VVDFNNDGWDDLYLPGGVNPDMLYRNNGDGTFTNVADTFFRDHNSGKQTRPRGGTAFDFDNDGLTDIYETTENDDILWKNNGDGTFTDVSVKAHLSTSLDQNESNGASFGDFDGDGDNDFFVARWTDEQNFLIDTTVTPHTILYANKGFPDWFYVNNGDGTFTERAKEFHVDGDTAVGNIVLFFDYDRDGDLDILIGNDFGVQETPNRVFKNMLMETGKATFVDVTDSINMGQKLFCMAIAPNDFNRDGQFDFFETSVGPQRMMQNDSNIFKDVAAQIGIPNGYSPGHGDTMTTTWTTLFSDFDNNGWEDAFVVHGYISTFAPWIAIFHDTSGFLRNLGGTFEDYTHQSGVLFTKRARGAALFDYDHDGKEDIVAGSMGADDLPGLKTSDFHVFHNITPPENTGHWLEMKCTAKRTAKEGIGTIIDVWAGGAVRSRQVNTGGGQGSMNTLMQHVGLGSYMKADSINVFWPADKNRHRQIDHYENIAADHFYYVTENMGTKPDTSLFSVNPPVRTAVKNIPKLSAPEVYPNPARNVLNVQNLQPSITKRFEIYDLLGIRQLDITGSESAFSFSVGNLKAGCYVLRITSSGETITKQFIKE
ncbi:MAG: FG-GAP-like repeat-containing protein, partial [Candidatus Kapaibacterium sp.]